jgi:hypothetical protein
MNKDTLLIIGSYLKFDEVCELEKIFLIELSDNHFHTLCKYGYKKFYNKLEKIEACIWNNDIKKLISWKDKYAVISTINLLGDEAEISFNYGSAITIYKFYPEIYDLIKLDLDTHKMPINEWTHLLCIFYKSGDITTLRANLITILDIIVFLSVEIVIPFLELLRKFIDFSRFDELISKLLVVISRHYNLKNNVILFIKYLYNFYGGVYPNIFEDLNLFKWYIQYDETSEYVNTRGIIRISKISDNMLKYDTKHLNNISVLLKSMKLDDRYAQQVDDIKIILDEIHI